MSTGSIANGAFIGVAFTPFVSYLFRPEVYLSDLTLEKWTVACLKGEEGGSMFLMVSLACAIVGAGVSCLCVAIERTVIRSGHKYDTSEAERMRGLVSRVLHTAVFFSLLPVGMFFAVMAYCNHTRAVLDLRLVWPDSYSGHSTLYLWMPVIVCAIIGAILATVPRAFWKHVERLESMGTILRDKAAKQLWRVAVVLKRTLLEPFQSKLGYLLATAERPAGRWLQGCIFVSVAGLFILGLAGFLLLLVTLVAFITLPLVAYGLLLITTVTLASIGLLGSFMLIGGVVGGAFGCPVLGAWVGIAGAPAVNFIMSAAEAVRRCCYPSHHRPRNDASIAELLASPIKK